MQENNVSKTIRNSGFSVFAQITTMVLQFVNRRVFIMVLDIEYLGYQSLFGNILSLLSVAELGIVNVISFHLYKELNDKNEEEIGKLMFLYKWMYRIVALVVLIAGIGCYFFLPFFVEVENADWDYLKLIYILQLGAVVAGYFFSYRRTIFFADQKEYKCIKIELSISAIIQAVQMIGLFLFHNYIVYLVINLSSSLISNAIIAYKSNKEYPFLKKKYKATLYDIKRRNMIEDMANMLIHKISVAIYSGTDSIVISKFCGIRAVALYGNYFMLQTGVLKVALYSLLNPVQATIGYIVHGKRDKEELWNQFQILDVFSFFFASYIAMGFYVFYQPVISFWLGSQFLLSNEFVMLNVFTIYFGVLWEIVCKYRTVLGNYDKDRNFMILSAILNITISVIAAQHIGIEGVQLGTLIAFFPIGLGRVYFVVKGFFDRSMGKYLMKHLLLFIVFSAECILIRYITSYFPVTITGLLYRVMIWFLIPGFVGTLIFGKSAYFSGMLEYLYKVFSIFANKLKRK